MIDRKQLFFDLLRCLEGDDQNREISIFIGDASWDFEAQYLKDLLRTFLFTADTLRNSLDLAEKDIATLQEQIAGGTLSFERPKWEYWETPFNTAMNYISHFNKKGAEGWELVHCDFGKGKALFKRAK